MNQKIELTKSELEEIKNTIKFREKVLLQLKQLNGLPAKVTKLAAWTKANWVITIVIIGSLLALALRVLAK